MRGRCQLHDVYHGELKLLSHGIVNTGSAGPSVEERPAGYGLRERGALLSKLLGDGLSYPDSNLNARAALD